MGQEELAMVDDSVAPLSLSARTLPAVAEYIHSGRAKNIVVLTGAGISTAAGIPDFRSPRTGLYRNLARLSLPYPEAVFDIDYFRRRPEPFYVLAHELYPGNFHPTVSHAFIALLARKGLLRMLFTQNIDCLERAAGIPDDKIIEAHGSFATQRCIDCLTAFPDDSMREHVSNSKVPRCVDAACNGLVKPDIVFFGEPLSSAFFRNTDIPLKADLVLVIGTSLTVYPFAGLPDMFKEGTPRVLFNMERVGRVGSKPDDVVKLGSCDDGIRALSDALGWREELEQLWRGVVGNQEAERQLQSRVRRQDGEKQVHSGGRRQDSERKLPSRDRHQDVLVDEIDELTDGVEAVLKIQQVQDQPRDDMGEHQDVGANQRKSPSPDGPRQSAAPRPPDTPQKPAIIQKAMAEPTPVTTTSMELKGAISGEAGSAERQRGPQSTAEGYVENGPE